MAKRIPGRPSRRHPLTIKTNPGKSARQGREPTRNKIAHRSFCAFRTSSWHACPRPADPDASAKPHPFQKGPSKVLTFNFQLSIEDPDPVGSVNLPPRPPALQHFRHPSSSFLLSSFCLLVSSPIPSELYPFVFFTLQNLSNKYVNLLNTSTIISFDKQYNSW